VEYDILGRVKRSTVPTEMNGSWNPAGDDNRGNDAQGNPIWQWQAQEYDWKSRVTREINVDGTDRLIFYAGCGCSGNQVVTVQSESVPRDDQPTVNARRTQKIYADALGRNWKTENLNWDAGVYTTTVNTFNGRDQITNTRQYAGTDDPNNTYQDASVTYDGHGRIKTRHYPIEDAGANTTWYYNADDSVQQVVDPRGATTNFTYNDARGLLTNVTYSSPNTTQIPDAPSVSFGYDAVGNRITMTDGTGTAGYAYDSLSRLTSETKTLTGLTGNFTIAYGYHIGGGLKSITDPFSSTVNYANDKTGRLTSVSGTPFGNNTSGNYADGIQYRAFGAIKQMNYKTDDNALVSMQYDSRLRVSDYQVASAAVTGGFVQKSSFEYFADSRPKAVDNALDAGFDRTFKYDFDGRLSSNQFGISTRPDGQQFTTYSQTIAYDAFSNMTSRQTGIWSGAESFTAAYTNGRRQAASGESLVFDALGNIVDITYTSGRTRFERSKFDAAGRMKEFSKRQQYGGGQSTFYDITKITTQFYDGDGERVKEVERGESTQNPAPPGVAQPVITETSKYYVRSTVTGKIITELDSAGGKTTTKVYVGSALLAEQRIYPGTQQIPGWSEVVWQHGDPVTGSIQQTLKSGELAIYVAPRSRRELEPLGGIVPTSDPYYSEEINSPEYNYGGDIFRPEFGCTLPETGQPAPCSVAAALMNYLDGINQTTGNLGNYFRRQAAGRTIPGFIRADNRRDDESEQIPGLRRVERYEGREFVGFMWAVDNSVAAQNVQKETDQQKKQRLLNEAISATRNILASNNSCSNLFGISAVSGFDSMVAVAQLGKLPSDNTGIRQSLTISRYHATKGIRPIIESNSLNGSIPIYPITTPSSFTVNESNSGLFFRSQAYFGYTGVQSRVLQLLHELAHLTVTGFTSEGVEKALKKRGYVQESFLIKSDKGDSAQSDINTKKVLDECKTQIDAIASGGN
jgi:YD repeat-containing protein